MNRKAYPNKIPTKTSELYNDGGFLNESEVDEKIEEGFNLDDATNGQLLSCAVVGSVKSIDWVDPPSSGGKDYSNDTSNYFGETVKIGSTTYKVKEFIHLGSISLYGYSTTFSDFKILMGVNIGYMSNGWNTISSFSISSVGTLNVASSSEKPNSIVYVKYISTETV